MYKIIIKHSATKLVSSLIRRAFILAFEIYIAFENPLYKIPGTKNVQVFDAFEFQSVFISASIKWDSLGMGPKSKHNIHLHFNIQLVHIT